jgi:hypothetical protein
MPLAKFPRIVTPDTVVSLALSFLALAISGLTAWLTLLRRATVKMTQPTVVYFGPDVSRVEGEHPKVFLRTLLYATAKRGCIVESMYVRLRRCEVVQRFNVWVYGEEHLTRGSGLFIPDAGVTTNHHFLLPFDGARFAFLPGMYTLELFASVVGEKSSRLLTAIVLCVTEDQSAALASSEYGLYFDWSPDEVDYRSHIRELSGNLRIEGAQ